MNFLRNRNIADNARLRTGVVCAVVVCFAAGQGIAKNAVGFVDSTHRAITAGFNNPILWFDSFFNDEKYIEEVKPHSLLLIQNSFVFSEGGNFVSEFRAFADVNLPKATDKLKITFLGAGRNNLQKEFPDEDIQPDIVKKEEERSFYVGARYLLVDMIRTKINLSGGVKMKIPPYAYSRIRFRQKFPELYTVNSRFLYTALWHDREGFKYSPKLEFDRLFSNNILLRLSGLAATGDRIDGTIWESDIYLYFMSRRRSAISVTAKVYGESKPAINTTLARVGVGFRRNFFREWFFYEVAPEIQWPRDELGGRKAVPAVVLKLQMRFETAG